MKKIFVLLAVLTLGGCSADNPQPDAEKVRLTNNEPGKDCKYLGEIKGNQVNFLTGEWTSNSNLETGAANDLKNQVLGMEAT